MLNFLKEKWIDLIALIFSIVALGYTVWSNDRNGKQLQALETRNVLVQAYFDSIEHLGNKQEKQYAELAILAILNLTEEANSSSTTEEVSSSSTTEDQLYNELDKIIYFTFDASFNTSNEHLYPQLREICEKKNHSKCRQKIDEIEAANEELIKNNEEQIYNQIDRC